MTVQAEFDPDEDSDGGAPILLVGDTLPAPVRDHLAANAGRIERVYVLGGPAAVNPSVIAELEAILGVAVR